MSLKLAPTNRSLKPTSATQGPKTGTHLMYVSTTHGPFRGKCWTIEIWHWPTISQAGMSQDGTCRYSGGKGHLVPTFLKYLDGQTIGQYMASAPPVSGELLVRGNAESELEETLRTVGKSPDFDKST